MSSDQEIDARIKEMADEIRSKAKGTEVQKDLLLVKGLIDFNVRALQELSKRVGELEEKIR